MAGSGKGQAKAVGHDETGEKLAVVGVIVRWTLQSSGGGVAKIPVPLGDGIDAAVNTWAIELNSQRSHAVCWTGGKLDGINGCGIEDCYVRRRQRICENGRFVNCAAEKLALPDEIRIRAAGADVQALVTSMAPMSPVLAATDPASAPLR